MGTENNNSNIKDINVKLDIEEAKYFVKKYIIITVHYLCEDYGKEEKCMECRKSKKVDKKCNYHKEYKDIVSANQIRKFLAAVNQINNKLLNKDNKEISNNCEKISNNIIDDIKYMKAQLAYLVGRNKDNKIRDFNKKKDHKKNGELNKELESNILKSYKDKEIYDNNKRILDRIDNKIGIEALYMRILPKIDHIIEYEKLEDFKELARYIEAIVAYHRFYGGK